RLEPDLGITAVQLDAELVEVLTDVEAEVGERRLNLGHADVSLGDRADRTLAAVLMDLALGRRILGDRAAARSQRDRESQGCSGGVSHLHSSSPSAKQ